MTWQPPAGRPRRSAPASALRRIPRRPATLAAAAVGCAVVVVALAAAASGSGRPQSGAPGVQVTASGVRTVVIQGAPGQLTIVGRSGSRVTLTGQLNWTGHAPAVAARFDRASGILHLTYRCAAASPCTENYRLAVPRRTAVVLRQPAGHVVISRLARPLSITAARVDGNGPALPRP